MDEFKEEIGPEIEPKIKSELLEEFENLLRDYPLPEGYFKTNLAFSTMETCILQFSFEIVAPETQFKQSKIKEWVDSLPIEVSYTVSPQSLFGLVRIKVTGVLKLG